MRKISTLSKVAQSYTVLPKTDQNVPVSYQFPKHGFKTLLNCVEVGCGQCTEQG